MATTTANEILELLRSSDTAVRQFALTELSDVLDETALEPLLEAAVDPDATVRELAIGLLEELGDARGTPALVNALNDESERVRHVAAGAVRDLRSPEAVELLVRNLRHRNPEVRAASIAGLREYRATSAEPALAECLQDESAEVRAQAVIALGHLRSETSILALRGRFKDADPECGAWRSARSTTRVRTGRAALGELLGDDDWRVRADAAKQLGKHGHRGAARTTRGPANRFPLAGSKRSDAGLGPAGRQSAGAGDSPPVGQRDPPTCADGRQRARRPASVLRQ